MDLLQCSVLYDYSEKARFDRPDPPRKRIGLPIFKWLVNKLSAKKTNRDPAVFAKTTCKNPT